jgi:hypothetical protein
MNSKRRTGYGVYDLSRQVARRLQQEWEAVECPSRPAGWSAKIIVLPRPDRHPARIQRQPLAA